MNIKKYSVTVTLILFIFIYNLYKRLQTEHVRSTFSLHRLI